MTEDVAEALEQIRGAFSSSTVGAREDGNGGAYVTVEPVDLGPCYAQRETWIGFQITFQYPNADVYPHFVREDLTRADGQALGDGMSPGVFDGQPGIQVSRRSNRLNPATDTAALKLVKVMEWLRSR